MKSRYNIDWLTGKYENGNKLKFLFFWGHTLSPNNSISNSCFSQWFESPFEVNGIIHKTSEHWMMSQKALLFDNKEIHEQIINSKTPAEAKELGRKVIGFNESIWRENRIEIVRLGNIHKFNQNRELGEYLINTKDRVLVEASPLDIIWGIGLTKDSEEAKNIYSWRGQNLLGFALMEVRDFLKNYGFFNGDFEFLPPWLIEPTIGSQDIYWRMGKGEEILVNFSKKWIEIDDVEREIYKVCFPSPKEWIKVYE